MSDFKVIEVEANGVTFTAFEHGPQQDTAQDDTAQDDTAQLMLCLHGFPDDATTWRRQMSYFAKAGYRVVAPYMRGYAPTSPAPTGTYQSAALARDAAALIAVLSPDRPAVLVGHDWGAIAAYPTALLAPERVEKLVTMSVPYGPAFGVAFATSYEQQKRSWYIFLFQTMLAEMMVGHDDQRFLRNLWRDWSPGWDFSQEEIAPVLETFARPGVLTAALAYYRCMLDPNLQDPALMTEQVRDGIEPVLVPTLYMHGDQDGCVGLEMAQGMEASFPAGLTRCVVEGAGHFLHREKPDVVNAQILRFLGK